MAVIARLFIPFAWREHFNCLWLATIIIKWSEKKTVPCITIVYMVCAFYLPHQSEWLSTLFSLCIAIILRSNNSPISTRLSCKVLFKHLPFKWSSQILDTEVVFARLNIQLFCIATQRNELPHNCCCLFLSLFDFCVLLSAAIRCISSRAINLVK